MIKIICIILFILTEIPFVIKFINAQKSCEITKQTAILIIMLITALIYFGIYKLVLFVIK